MAYLIPFPHNGLVSYHYSSKMDLSLYGQWSLIGDSGAFSALTQGVDIDIDALSDWAVKWQAAGQLCWAAALDVIGDHKATHRNWLRMKGRGVKCVPTIHFPSPPRMIDDYAKDGVRFLGLGGQVGGNQASLMRWVVSVMRYARDTYPDMRFHGWGATSKGSLQLPYYSVDSTSWYEGVMWGSTSLQDPRDPAKIHRLDHDGKDAFRPEMANLLSTYYGVDPASVADSRGSNWNVVELMARSASLREIQLQQRHGVISAPPDHPGLEDGPRLHLVMPSDTSVVKKMAAVLAEERAAAKVTVSTS